MSDERTWNILPSGQGYYAQLDLLTEDFKVGPWSTPEKAQEYIDEHGDDSIEDIKLYQEINFNRSHGNG